jgi:hypothetical protein
MPSPKYRRHKQSAGDMMHVASLLAMTGAGLDAAHQKQKRCFIQIPQ